MTGRWAGDFAAASKYGVKAEGSQAALNAAALAELAQLKHFICSREQPLP